MKTYIPRIFGTLELGFDLTAVPENMDQKNATKMEKKLLLNARRNFRRLSKKHHPDHGGDATAFQNVKEAYELIKIVKLKPHQFHQQFVGIQVGLFGSGLIDRSNGRWQGELDPRL